MSQPTRLRSRIWTALAACGVVAAVGGLALFSGQGEKLTWAAAPAPSAAVQSANDLSAAFRAASEEVLPSVVTIQAVYEEEVTQTPGLSSQQWPEEFDPLFKQFFGDELPEFGVPQPHRFHREGTGSGVIIDPSGIILTNNHVAGNAGKVIVKLNDGREFTATDIKTDPKTDLAIVRIEGAGTLPAAELGDSDVLQIGDWVLAIGSPFGLDATVTAGIISAKSRGMGIAEREDFLQTDAAINPGNSGGPLVNLSGQVVGINTAISTRGGGSDGIGFAVPINLARWVTKQLVNNGSVERAFLGIGIQQVNSELSKQFGLETVHGAVVTEVRPGTPAEKAGLKVGDVVVKFDGHSVASPRDLQNQVERAGLDTSHQVTVLRDGEEVQLKTELQPMPATLVSTHTSASPEKAEFNQLGLQVGELSADVAKQLGLPDASGVVITSVAPDSAAAELGLRDGMVIARVGSHPVKSLSDFQAAIKDADLNAGVLLLVKSADGSRFVVLKNE